MLPQTKKTRRLFEGVQTSNCCVVKVESNDWTPGGSEGIDADADADEGDLSIDGRNVISSIVTSSIDVVDDDVTDDGDDELVAKHPDDTPTDLSWTNIGHVDDHGHRNMATTPRANAWLGLPRGIVVWMITPATTDRVSCMCHPIEHVSQC